MNNDIMLLCSSPISFDRDNILSLISDITHRQIEISILSFEIPMGILNTISSLTKGVIVHPQKAEDINDFFTYMIYKRAVRETIKLGLAGCRLLKENYLICSCHHRLCCMVYTCKICNDQYCSLPAYCRHCNTFNLNSALVYQLKQGYVEEKEHMCFPYKLQTYYTKNINKQKYQELFTYTVTQLLKTNKKDFLKTFAVNPNSHNTPNDSNAPVLKINDVNLSFQIKLLFLYLKYSTKSSTQYNNLMKIIPINQTIEDYVKENTVFLLKNGFVCSGCDAKFHITKTDDLTRIFVYNNCFDIFCEECYQYIYDNDLGCLACE